MNYLPFTALEGSLPCPQEPATEHCLLPYLLNVFTYGLFHEALNSSRHIPSNYTVINLTENELEMI